jgi:hypothetical protein
LTENDLQIGDGAEVETENIETGETTLMTGHQGAGRTLLTRGPVVEVMPTRENLRLNPMLRNPAKYALSTYV